MCSAEVVANVLRRNRFQFADEDMLQEGIAAALTGAGFDVEREVRLNAQDRIDLLVGAGRFSRAGVGVEVKVAGQFTRVAQQLARYARSERIDELVLVTTRASHPGAAVFAAYLCGCPIEVVNLAGAGL